MYQLVQAKPHWNGGGHLSALKMLVLSVSHCQRCTIKASSTYFLAVVIIGSCRQALFSCPTLDDQRKDNVGYHDVEYCAKEPSERQYSYCSRTSTRILFG